MSKKRSVDTHFWSDNFIIDLDPIEKLLFIYLLTNQNTNMLGVYELHIRRVSFDTGIDKDMVAKIFDRFAEKGKACYSDGYVCLYNFVKNQSYNANMLQSAIDSFHDLPESIQIIPQVMDLYWQLITIGKDKKWLAKGYTPLTNDSFSAPEKTEPLPKDKKGLPKDKKGLPNPSEPIANIESESELESETETEREGESESPPGKSGIISHPTIKQCREYAEMSGHNPDYGESYFHLRDADGWLRRSGEQMIPIANPRSDYVNCYNKGYLKLPETNSLPY